MVLRNICFKENENEMLKFYSILIFFWVLFILFLGIQPANQQDLKPVLAEIIPQEILKEKLPHFEINYQGTIRSTENLLELIHFFLRKTAHFFSMGSYLYW